MRPLIIIPARYNSTRFPGKPLVNILGESLIYRVWRQCVKIISFMDVYVATDDYRIVEHCMDHGMKYIMTSKGCLTGTDRVAEAYKKIEKDYDVIINVQGDEPLIKPKDILEIAKYIKDGYSVACGYCKLKCEEEFRNPNIIKVVNNNKSKLLYASRAGIPTCKNLEFHSANKQVCIYAFNEKSLTLFYNYGKVHGKSSIENIEDIEILRFLDLGEKVQMHEVSESSISVDVPEDVKRIEEIMKGV